MEQRAFLITDFFLTSIKQFHPARSYIIGIGLSDTAQRNLEIINAFLSIMNENSDFPLFKQIYLVFYAPVLKENHLELNLIRTNTKFALTESEKHEEKIIADLTQNKLDAIIRGSISANKLLAIIKKTFYNTSDITLNRLALLETASGHQFFFAPVGIDEAETVERKVEFIKLCDQLFKKLDLKIHVNILGEGRIGDKGRSKIIDEKLDTTMMFLEQLKILERAQSFNTHYDYKEILIENSIDKDNPCMVFAPDGISGNLIYRTLIHLGAGKSYGAVYLREFLEKRLIIIDTSRVAPEFELKGALIFAIGLIIQKSN